MSPSTPENPPRQREQAATVGQVPHDTPTAAEEKVLEARAAPTEGNRDPAPAREQVPQRFGDYELLGEIARGGMGVVYRARQISLNRPVALKMILSARLATPELVGRFRQEAEAAARLSHPGIVPVFQVGEIDGQHFFSMALVEGGSLEDRLRNGPLPPREAARLVKAIAEAVQHAHARNIVHRDLKPANILLDAQGRPQVTDFGLAKELSGGAGLSASGQILGTPSYMAPEQATGRLAEVGPLADVYALGAILYALLTAQPPFEGTSALDTLQQVVCQEPLSPRRINPRVDLDLATVCLTCLEKDPGRRYASAQALADELGRYLDGVPIVARPVGRLERGRRWLRRHPAQAAALALGLVVLLTLVGLGVGSAYQQQLEGKNAELENANSRLNAQAQKLESSNAQLQEAAQKLAASNANLAAAREDLERLFYLRRVSAALTEWKANEVGRARKLLDACPPAYRHWEWHYVARLCQTGATLTGHGGEVRSVAFGADGKTVASAARPGGAKQTEVSTWDPSTGKRLGSRELPTDGGPFVLSPDGTRLVSADAALPFHSGPTALRVWDVATGKQLLVLEGHRGVVSGLAFSPDGKWLASGSTITDKGKDLAAQKFGPTVLKVWHADTGLPLHTLDVPGKGLGIVAFSPDSKQLVIAGNKGVRVLEVESAHDTAVLPQHTLVQSAALAPDGQHVALALSNILRIVNLRTKLETRAIELPSAVKRVAFSPDGKRLLTCNDDRSVTVCHVAAGRVTHTFRGHAAAVGCLAVSPDGRHVASGSFDKTLRMWDLEGGQEVTALSEPELSEAVAQNRTLPPITQAVFSPDDKWLVTACKLAGPGAGNLQVWDAAANRLVRSLQAHQGRVADVAFSPDGKRLASAGTDRTVKVWDAATWTLALTVTGHRHPPLRVAFGPGGLVASLSTDDSQALELKIWEADSGREIRTLREGLGFGHALELDLGAAPLTQLAFSPDGAWLVTAAGDPEPHPTMKSVHAPGPLKVWDTATGRLLRTIDAGPRELLRSLAVSPDGKRIVTARHDFLGQTADLKVWSVETGAALVTLEPAFAGKETRVEDVAFSPDGKRVAGVVGDTVVLWEADTGRDIISLKNVKTPGRFQSVAFSPDGRRLAVACTQGMVFLWDARSGLWPDDRGP
jgi:WD40 repeat protein